MSKILTNMTDQLNNADLNSAQQRAVLHVGTPLLIVAGAGSGKTTVLTRKIAFLLQQSKATEQEILAITFTNKAANQMREQVQTLLGMSANNMWIMTFHAMCVRVLRYYGNFLAKSNQRSIDNNFTIYDTEDSKRLISLILSELDLDTTRFSTNSVLAQISNWKNQLYTPARVLEFSNTDEYLKTLAEIYGRYQLKLVTANACDFDDLINNVVWLFKDNPDILTRYRKRFKYILVDEYQDTNYTQYQLISLLAGINSITETPELTVVGDADQSIYAFRGATIRNIEEFTKDFSNATTIVLDQNYRSTQNILTAANEVIAKNMNRAEKRLWSDLGTGSLITGFVADNEYHEATFMVETINKLVDQGEVNYRDIAVFYRTNIVSRTLEEALVRYNIPYRIVGGLRFYDRKEIKDIFAYLKLIQNHNDDLSLLRIINVPKRALGASSVAKISLVASELGLSYFAALQVLAQDNDSTITKVKVNSKTKKSLQDFLRLINDLTQKSKTIKTFDELASFISKVIEQSGYAAVLQESSDFVDANRLDNLMELVAIAKTFDQNFFYQSDELSSAPGDLLTSFLAHTALSSTDDKTVVDNSVTLMTLHTAKGLEYNTVFLVGWSEGLFPHFRAFNSGKELAEERRLAYVGLTRAQQNLYISYAVTRGSFGKTIAVCKSRFIDDIPPELIYWQRSEPEKKFLPEYSDSDWEGIPLVDNDFPKETNKYKPVNNKKLTKTLRQLNLAIGDLVNHDKYGMGKVIDLQGSGITETVTVDFGSSGTVKLMTLGGLPMEKL